MCSAHRTVTKKPTVSCGVYHLRARRIHCFIARAHGGCVSRPSPPSAVLHPDRRDLALGTLNFRATVGCTPLMWLNSEWEDMPAGSPAPKVSHGPPSWAPAVSRRAGKRFRLRLLFCYGSTKPWGFPQQ
ncbi:hypothetical protein NDU88_001347 [Pleurodeles waltl]|uniref:Uncharacterized protein n=1 Tax=Pleurodeles waltl TaxID=8319 RepID=A0AAV7NJT2_PLEWA|nr:hypothetical protein NDU88_001347 [Pleurodeles waltl]